MENKIVTVTDDTIQTEVAFLMERYGVSDSDAEDLAHNIKGAQIFADTNKRLDAGELSVEAANEIFEAAIQAEEKRMYQKMFGNEVERLFAQLGAGALPVEPALVS